MRREKTLKVCANHSILPWMDMKPNCGSQKAWVWKTQADYADEEPKQEVHFLNQLKTGNANPPFKTMAIRFGNIENAKKFFDAFEEMRNYVLKMEAKKIREEIGEEASVEKVDKEKDTEEKDLVKDTEEQDLVKDTDAGGDKFQALKERMANMAVGDEE